MPWWKWNEGCVWRLFKGIRAATCQVDLLVLADALEEASYPDTSEPTYLREIASLKGGNALKGVRLFKRLLKQRLLAVQLDGLEGKCHQSFQR